MYWIDIGDYVEADEVVARIETDKVTVDILAQHSGIITKVFAEEGDTLEVGADFLEIDTEGKPSAAPAKEAAPEKVAETPAAQSSPAASTPAPSTPAPAAPKAQTPVQPAPTPSADGGPAQVTSKKAPTAIGGQRLETRVKMNKMRQTIARKLKES